MSNEQEWKEIMAQRAKEREQKTYDRFVYQNGREDGYDKAKRALRSFCECTCGKCGCCR